MATRFAAPMPVRDCRLRETMRQLPSTARCARREAELSSPSQRAPFGDLQHPIIEPREAARRPLETPPGG
jgi:hypothetical protein